MTKSAAIAKAKKHASQINDMNVVEKNGDYEVIHAAYLDEFIEDGYTFVCGFKYDYELIKY